MRHFMTYEFIYEFMYMKNIVKSYLNSCVPRFQMQAPGTLKPLKQVNNPTKTAPVSWSGLVTVLGTCSLRNQLIAGDAIYSAELS